MHHKNNRHSTANHSNPQHHKNNNNLPTGPAPGGASTPKRSGILNRISERFKEKPATAEEVAQLGLNAKREIYKTQIKKAKQARPSRFSGFGGGGQQQRQPSYRRSSSHNTEEPSWLFSNKESGSSFMSTSDFGEGVSNMFGGGSQKKKGKNQKSGLDDLF